MTTRRGFLGMLVASPLMVHGSVMAAPTEVVGKLTPSVDELIKMINDEMVKAWNASRFEPTGTTFQYQGTIDHVVVEHRAKYPIVFEQDPRKAIHWPEGGVVWPR